MVIDESANNRYVENLVGLLFTCGFIASSDPLWDQRRRLPSGEMIDVQGGVPPWARGKFEYGKRVDHCSTSDRDIVGLLSANFVTHDRIVLLTGDIEDNRDGLTQILMYEVQPALKQYSEDRLGLLVLAKHGKADYPTYCQLAQRHLVAQGARPGFSYLVLPEEYVKQ